MVINSVSSSEICVHVYTRVCVHLCMHEGQTKGCVKALSLCISVFV